MKRASDTAAALCLGALLFASSILASLAHPETWKSHLDSGDAAYRKGDYAAAQGEFATALIEETFGPQDPRLALNLYKLAEVYRAQANYAAAEALQQRSLAIREKVLGPEHPDVAESLNGLAQVYQALRRYDQAESLYQRCLTILGSVMGPDDPNLAIKLNNLATLYRDQGKADTAELTFKRSLWILEHAPRSKQSNLKHVSGNLGRLYFEQGKYADAVPLLWRALDSTVQTLLPFSAAYFSGLALALIFNRKMTAREPTGPPARWPHFVWKSLLLIGTVFMMGSLLNWNFSYMFSSVRSLLAVGTLVASVLLFWITARKKAGAKTDFATGRRITNIGVVFYGIVIYILIIGYSAGPWAAANTAFGDLMSATKLRDLFVGATIYVAVLVEWVLEVAGVHLFRLRDRREFF